jgi:hypothetical protein
MRIIAGQFDPDEMVRRGDDVERTPRAASSRLVMIGCLDDQAAVHEWPRQAGQAGRREIQASGQLAA